MEVVVSTGDSLANKIKSDCVNALASYIRYGYTEVFNKICTSNSLLDYIENNETFNLCCGEIQDTVSSVIETFISDLKFTVHLPEEELKQFIENKDDFADKIAFLYFYEIKAIRTAKQRRKDVEKLEKELDIYHGN